MRYLLNSAVIPSPGTYRYRLIAVAEVKAWLHALPWQSRIGYPATAEHIRAIAGVDVSLSREATAMAAGDEALVVRLKYRLDNPATKAAHQPAPDDWEYGLLTKIGDE